MSQKLRRVCYFHAGCPDGFGAAWAVWRGWNRSGEFFPFGHDERVLAHRHETDQVVFVDITPDPESLRELMAVAAQVVVLDHHVTALQRYQREPSLAREVADGGHLVEFDLSMSGATLAWQHFGGGASAPELLRYVEDQDLWRWALPGSDAVNAALGSYPRRFDVWDDLAARPIEELAREGAALVRAQKTEVERALLGAHELRIDGERIEAVNASWSRALIGHSLAERAAFGRAWGCVYRVFEGRADLSLYSIGDLDVASIAGRFGGGGHRNAAGFSVPLALLASGTLDSPRRS